MGNKVFRGNIKFKGTPVSGSGDPLLTRDTSTSELGTTANALGTLTSAHIFVGNGSNVPTDVAVTGDISIDNTGLTAIASDVIVNADINSSAAIALSKLAALTASRALVSDGSGVISVSAATSTEVGYLSGVTSAIQTQLGAKQATITGAASTIVSSNLTANRATISNASGKMDVSAVTSTELGYLSGVTSTIQTQLDSKFVADITSVAEGDILYFNGTEWINLARGTNGQALYSTATSIQWDTPTINGIPIGGSTGQVLAKQSGTDFDADWETLVTASITDITATAAELNILSGATLTTTELNYVSGVTSPIQPQIDGKQSSSLPQNAIWVGNSSGLAAALAGGTNGYVLTSVSGVPTWQPISAGSPPGSDTQVIFNDGGSFGADAGMVYDKTANELSVQRVLLSPSATLSGLNVGSLAGNPSSLSNGDIWYNSTSNALNARINGATVTLGLGVTDGDKGDITVSSTGTVWTIDNDAVTYGKIQNVSAASKLLGRGDSGSGDVQEITLGSGLSITGTTISSTGGVSGLTTNRIPYATSATTLGDDSALTWDATNNAITVGSVRIFNLGSQSVFVGDSAGNFTLTAINSTALGRAALNSLTSGNGNTAIGSQAGLAITSGASNTLLGTGAGILVSTGASNILLGGGAGANITTGTNNIVIGSTISAQSATTDNQLSIQNIIFGTGNSATGTTVSTGNIGIGVTAPSAKLDVDGAVKVKSYTVAGVPSASTNGAGSVIYVSNESGGAVLAFSDGTDWRRVTDRAVIS
jgi:hypothetical protein